MSFFNKLCRSLGFGDGDEYEVDDVIADDNDSDSAEPSELVEKSAGDAAEEQQQLADIREAIFAHVVKVFNTALPDFLAKSVDPEAQRKVLYDSLDQGLKDYLAKIGAEADNRCELRWSNEHKQLRADMEDLRHKSEQVEAERAELKQRQLSAERQKRALSDRLKDLEKQVEGLEAEREQFDLENKSLLNKLKVMAVQGGDNGNDRTVVTIDDAADKEEMARMEEHTQELEDKIKALTNQLEQAADRQKMADEMNSDLRNRLAVSVKEVEDLQAITEQVSLIQQAIAERDEKIKQQRDNIARLKEQINTVTSASQAAEERRAAREKELLGRIAELEAKTSVSELVSDPEQANEQKKPRKRQANKKMAETESVAPKITDDDLMDVENGFADHSWFGASEPMPAPQQTANENDDFGYHAPEPKPRPYDDGMQMSLFD